MKAAPLSSFGTRTWVSLMSPPPARTTGKCVCACASGGIVGHRTTTWRVDTAVVRVVMRDGAPAGAADAAHLYAGEQAAPREQGWAGAPEVRVGGLDPQPQRVRPGCALLFSFVSTSGRCRRLTKAESGAVRARGRVQVGAWPPPAMRTGSKEALMMILRLPDLSPPPCVYTHLTVLPHKG